MKLHLPKALFAAVLTTASVYGEEVVTTIQPNPNGTSPNIVLQENILNVDSDTALHENEEYKETLTQGKIDGATPSLGYAIVKDGEGTLKINDGEDTVLNNIFVVREGTVEISNGSHVKNAINYSNHTANLYVGGKDAKLVLDIGSYSQNIPNCYVSPAVLGTADGAAIVELKNGSLLHTDHYIMAGDIGGNYNVDGNKEYGPIGYITYTTTDGKLSGRYEGGDQTVTVTDVKGNEVTTTTYIKLDGQSEMSAGTSLQFSDVIVDIIGGSVLKDATKSGLSNKSTWPESYFGYDAADGVKTIINVYDGHLDCNWNLETGDSKDSVTKITVDGSNAKFSVAGEARFGKYSSDEKSDTQVILKNGALAQFNKVSLGDGRQASICVDGTSRVEKHEAAFDGAVYNVIEVFSEGSIDNAGTLDLDIVMQGGNLIAQDGATFAAITAMGGTLDINGAIIMTGDLTIAGLATLAEETTVESAVTLNFAEGAYIDMQGHSVNIADLTSINVTDADGNFTLFTNVANAEQLNNVEFSYTDANGDTQVGKIEVSNGNVYVGKDTTVPEPTTATLSLLALAALAGRRRRK